MIRSINPALLCDRLLNEVRIERRIGARRRLKGVQPLVLWEKSRGAQLLAHRRKR